MHYKGEGDASFLSERVMHNLPWRPQTVAKIPTIVTTHHSAFQHPRTWVTKIIYCDML